MLAPGQIIAERYEVVEMIGEGGLAQVWKVRHRELGSMHALKLLLFRNKPRLAERLILEGRIQAQLRHPNLVSVTDVVRHGGQVGLVMEFIDGVPMSTWLEANAPLEPDRALQVMAPVLAAVRMAHEAGVLHRDLKPANILLARQGRTVVAKVTDFGIAKVVEGSYDAVETRTGAVMGTPGYLAPEQAVDASNVDARADQFALGAILYELLTGRRAWDGVNIAELAPPPPLCSVRPDLPRYLCDAVHRAMSIPVGDRFPDVLSFAAALFEKHPALLDAVGASDGSPALLALKPGGPSGDPPRPTLAPAHTPPDLPAAGATFVPPGPTVPAAPRARHAPRPPPPAAPAPRVATPPRVPAPRAATSRLWWVALGTCALALVSVAALVALRWEEIDVPVFYAAGPPPAPESATAGAGPSGGAGWRHPGRARDDEDEDTDQRR